MRKEIKFRLWDKKQERMLLPSNHVIAVGGGRIFINGFEQGSYRDNFSPMQYTGLSDKQGKEIYEGDLVKVKGYGEKPLEYFGVIEWWKETAMFGISHYKVINYYGMVLDDCWKGGLRFEDIKIETTEIIGNIYEKEKNEGI